MPDSNTRLFQPLHIALLAFAIIGLGVVWFWPKPAPPQPMATITEPAQPVMPVAVPATPEPEPQTTITPAEQAPAQPEPEPSPEPLPPLNASDPAVLSDFSTFDLSTLLAQEYLIRKTVRAVVAAANGEWVNQHRPISPPKTPFQVIKGQRITMGESNFSRYTPYINAIEAINPSTWAAQYQKYAPLLQEAYEELGVKGGSFEQSLSKALTLIETAPLYQGQPLSQPSVMFVYKDKALESLPEIQKTVMRLGPENQQRIQALCSKIKAQLDSPKPSPTQ